MTRVRISQRPRPSWGAILKEARYLARLAFPIVISLAAAALIGVVDTVMVAPLGTLPLAAVSITASVLIIFYSALYGFVSAIGVRMAEAFGKTSDQGLAAATNAGVFVSLVVGSVGAVAMICLKPALSWIGQPPEVVSLIGGYWIAMSLLLVPFTVFYTLKALFDAMNRPWIGVGLAFLAVGFNIPSNYVLIHGVGGWPGLGLVGAGIASLLSQIVPLIMALVIIRVWKRKRGLLRAASFDRSEVKAQLKEGFIISVGYLGEGAAYAVAGLMLGWFSAAALAAHQIVSAVSDVVYMVPLGVSIAISIRVAQAIGANEKERLKPIVLASLLVIVSWMAVVVTGILIGRAPLANSLSDDPKVVSLAISMFLVIAAMQIADGVQGTMLGAFRGMMDNHVPVAITLIAYWLFALPLGYALGFWLGFGPNGVWIGYGSGLSLAAIALTYRFFSQNR
ncbi:MULTISPECIES: MATE family efflux transporter [unclassified Ruegeria]|uniref:MATE family efflux transporter n=1 Tax=unclassified Ruegeria TaxID=2625375 RepID=UPI00147DC39D|nr:MULTISPECIES: MATE family efflux transporter [unclassified Ruegeria]NOD36140.1 MATE family efflux transporter [Ruegeria sp. HKCCD7296]NOD48478.1 MATE family efflux transporter [Ruegeria sp. HKCCD5849]NOD52498.1 MATE family efflux transporter [Ruegeria sp. HKCCD5851]NOD68601.1 MATE family efflux transporter [Ruegeria sp. HKCCD7303]NOE36305.1 MATE family efflux transporter [Ruegeria sp. HKCCD7318]